MKVDPAGRSHCLQMCNSFGDGLGVGIPLVCTSRARFWRCNIGKFDASRESWNRAERLSIPGSA